MTLPSLYKQNRYFFISYVVLAIFAVFILITYSKEAGFILMNPWHHRPLDYFFMVFTFLGDGLFVIAIALILFFLKKRILSLMIISSYALSGIIAQALKYFFEEARPAVYLEKTNYPYFIDEVTLHNLHSFPSGHTASAFALAAALAFAMRNKNYSILFLLMATLVGYSRIYLGQHFMDDVLAGSVIGVVSAIVCELFLEKKINKIVYKGNNK
jgi:membrane-associated phospholipid phosphatase